MIPEQTFAVTESAPTEPQRVKAFARFFKNYMSVSAIVAAALPIPIASFRLIPSYDAQTSFLSTYTSLFCFLILAFIFYSRHQLARWLFPEFFPTRTKALTRFAAVVPAILIAASLICVFCYHACLYTSMENVWHAHRDSLEREQTAGRGAAAPHAPISAASGAVTSAGDGAVISATPSSAASATVSAVASVAPTADPAHTGGAAKSTRAVILTQLELSEIPYSLSLMGFFLGIFIFAEAAFVLMAIKEYLQDLVRLSEIELIRGQRSSAP